MLTLSKVVTTVSKTVELRDRVQAVLMRVKVNNNNCGNISCNFASIAATEISVNKLNIWCSEANFLEMVDSGNYPQTNRGDNSAYSVPTPLKISFF